MIINVVILAWSSITITNYPLLCTLFLKTNKQNCFLFQEASLAFPPSLMNLESWST